MTQPPSGRMSRPSNPIIGAGSREQHVTEDQGLTTETESVSTDSATIDWAERRRERAQAKRSHSKNTWVVVALVSVAVVLLVSVLAEVALSAGRVHPGVTVAGIEIGGMAPEKAAAVLESRLQAKAAEAPVVVTFEERKWEIPSSQIALGYDVPATVQEAMSVGRAGGMLVALGDRLGSWFGGIAVPAHPVTDPQMLATTLDTIAEKTDIAPVDATLETDGPVVSVKDGKDGRGLVRTRAGELIMAAYLTTDRAVTAPVEVVPMAVDRADAEAAKAVADQMVSDNATVTFDGKSWEFTPDKIAGWLAFTRSDETSGSKESSAPADVTLVVSVDPEAAAKSVVPAVGTGVGRPAKDARFKTAAGKVTVIPSEDGIGPDMETLAANLTTKLGDESSDRTVELRTTRTEPKLTTDEARDMGVKERLSTYTTTYESGNRPRVNNIHLLGDSLDGKLIAPGATFSFNESVGERTAAKGYKEANAIVNGKLVPQLGGGICQVGTTLFNSIFESGLPVVSRKNHSFYISHYPKGRDATVSWGGPDLKFKNDTEDWVLISVSYTNSSITIALYGTDPGYEVTSSTGAWTNVRPYPTEEIKDPKLATGARIVEDSGVSGRTIVVRRIVKKDGKVIRDEKFTSVYRPKVQVVRVGTKPKASSSTTKTP